MKTETRFDSFAFSDEILKALEKKKFEFCSEIQAQAIPVILDTQRDVLGLAQTGTGKTAAFGLPLIEMIKTRNKTPKAIVLAPTRELAIQVSDEMNSFIGTKKLKIMPVYGGTAITNHIKDLKAGCDIVVGTPGRVLDLIKRRALDLNEIDYFVLDEADEMLNMGFLEDIETILAAANDNKRVFLFSATMPDGIRKITKKYMGEHDVIEIAKKKFNSELIKQIYFKLRYSEKFSALTKIIDYESFFYGIIFCKTRNDVDEVVQFLKKNKYEADGIHGEVAQNKREKILQRFRDQKLHMLVATDVAARGIDVNNLTHVINFSIPQELETYVHRIGRTGRAGNSGTAITFIGPKEEWVVPKLEKITNNSKLIKGTLPTVADLAQSNTDRMEKEIEKIMSDGSHKKFNDMTHKLITKFGPEGAVAALLHKMLHKDEVENPARERMKSEGFGRGRDERNSRGGRDRDSGRGRDRDDRRSRDRDSRGSDRFGGRDDRRSRDGGKPKLSGDDVRLFIAKGTHDGYKNREVVSYIEGKAGKINSKDVKACGAFSFVTVNKRDADKVLKAFKNEVSSNGRPVIEVAK